MIKLIVFCLLLNVIDEAFLLTLVFCLRAGPPPQTQGTNVVVLPKGRSSTANPGTKVSILPKGGIPPQTQEPRL